MNTNQQPAAAAATVTESELARAQAELAAGGDPFGDGDPLEFEQDDDTIEAQATGQDAAAADPAEGAAATPEVGTSGELTPEEIAATLAAISPQQAAELNIKVPDVAGIAEKIAALDSDRDLVEKKWMAGNLSDEDRLAELRKLNDQERKLNRELSKAETLAELAQQQESSKQQALAEEQAALIAGIRSRGATAGIDYSNAEIAKSFDELAGTYAPRMLAKGKTLADVFEAAHKAVCELEGVGYQPPGTQALQAPAQPGRRASPPIPPTIQGLPQAASQTTGGGLVEVMRGLKGHAYTEQWARLTPAQQAALLDD